MAALITRAEWQLRLALRRLGWQRVTALLALVLAAGLFVHAEWLLAHIHTTPAALAPAPHAAQPTYPSLDQTASLPGWLQAHASRAGLSLNQAQYDLESVGKHSRYRAILPLTGSYLALRQFLADALNHYPNLALESVQLQREKSTEENLSVRLVLVFYLSGRSSAQPAAASPP